MRRLLTLGLVFVLAGCASGPAPEAARAEPEAPTAVEPYATQPAVLALLERSRALADAGRPDEAAAQLDRALRIDPRDPAVLQARAERFLADGDPAQALNFAEKSFQRSSKRGELCRRNWATIETARRLQGDRQGAREASRRADFC
ncbi:MAG: tetratricopeptide repeat protein [Candidatus Competibacterales bacterium]|nr:tetratricopeptide repeat protein [Candidatus Competibacterales bacterium]